MKLICKIICLAIALYLSGCTSIHSFTFSPNQNSTKQSPVNLSTFLTANGLRKLPPDSGAFRMFTSVRKMEFKEIWSNEGVVVLQYWNNKTYVVRIEKWTSEYEARTVAKNLKKWLKDIPSIQVIYDKESVLDFDI